MFGYCRMPKGRVARTTQRPWHREVERDVLMRKSARQKVQTEKGSSYSAALHSAKNKCGDSPQAGQSCGGSVQHAKTTRQQGKTNSSDDVEEEEMSDDDSQPSDEELSEMLTRAKVAMSVIDKLADKLKSKSRSNTGNHASKQKTQTCSKSADSTRPSNKSADSSKKRAHSRDASGKSSVDNTVFQCVPLFPDLEDGEICDSDNDYDSDDVEFQRGRGASGTSKWARHDDGISHDSRARTLVGVHSIQLPILDIKNLVRVERFHTMPDSWEIALGPGEMSLMRVRIQ